MAYVQHRLYGEGADGIRNLPPNLHGVDVVGSPVEELASLGGTGRWMLKKNRDPIALMEPVTTYLLQGSLLLR